jgi:hypothetical protein
MTHARRGPDQPVAGVLVRRPVAIRSSRLALANLARDARAKVPRIVTASGDRRRAFLWSVMIVSARCSFRCRRRFSASSCFTRGSTGRALGPRFVARIPTSAPRSRCWRHVIRCELYNPSRRSNAPSSPDFLHASASLRMRRRLSALNRRRVGQPALPDGTPRSSGRDAPPRGAPALPQTTGPPALGEASSSRSDTSPPLP